MSFPVITIHPEMQATQERMLGVLCDLFVDIQHARYGHISCLIERVGSNSYESDTPGNYLLVSHVNECEDRVRDAIERDGDILLADEIITIHVL